MAGVLADAFTTVATVCADHPVVTFEYSRSVHYQLHSIVPPLSKPAASLWPPATFT